MRHVLLNQVISRLFRNNREDIFQILLLIGIMLIILFYIILSYLVFITYLIYLYFIIYIYILLYIFMILTRTFLRFYRLRSRRHAPKN